MIRSPLRLAVMPVALLVVTAWARAEPLEDYLLRDETERAPAADAAPRGEFLLGIGYTHMTIASAAEVLDESDGIRFDPSLTFAPLAGLPQLRLGAAVGVSFALDHGGGAVISSGGGLIVLGGGDITFTLIEPELRLSWRQPFGEHGQFFVEPGVGVGWAFGVLDLSQEAEDAGLHDSDSNAFGRVFLRAGARVSGGLAGIEASYMRGGKFDFGGGIDGDIGEFYIGLFGAIEF